jgi:esterase/lipase superfamily enzyme
MIRPLAFRLFCLLAPAIFCTTQLLGQATQAAANSPAQCFFVSSGEGTMLGIVGSEASNHKFAWDSDGFPLEGDKPYISLQHSQWDEGVFHVRAFDLSAQRTACEATFELKTPAPRIIEEVSIGAAAQDSAARTEAERQKLRDQLNAVLATKETDQGLIVTLGDVLFDTGKSNLRHNAQTSLAKISGILQQNPDLKLQINGYTDSVDSDDAYNLALSQSRATSTKAFLVRNGLSPDNVSISSFGKSNSVADNSTSSGRQQNRRVEMVVSGPSIGRSGQAPSLTATSSPHVSVYFLTERKPGSGKEIFEDIRDPDSKLHYGSLVVGVSRPQRRQDGFASQLWPDDKLTFEHSEITQWSESKPFLAAIAKQKIGGESAKQALLYIHGFNNGFDETVNKAAQLVEDTGFRGVPIVFDWPAKETKIGLDVVLTYPMDRSAVDSSTEHLATLITQLVQLYGAGNVHVVAHSLGNRVFMNAMTILMHSGQPVGLGQVIMAAPDIDAQLFQSNVDKLLAGNAVGVTLYGSQKDKAMWASWVFNHQWPVGRLSPIYPVRNLVQIDATAVSANFLGHDYFVTARQAINDISLILASPYKAPPRSLRAAAHNGYAYWNLEP